PGIANRSQRPSSVPEACILSLEGFLPDHGPDQPQHGTHSLERLACVVDHLIARPRVRLGQLLQSVAQLLSNDLAKTFLERFIGFEFKRHRGTPVRPAAPPETSLAEPTFFPGHESDWGRSCRGHRPPSLRPAPWRHDR